MQSSLELWVNSDVNLQIYGSNIIYRVKLNGI